MTRRHIAKVTTDGQLTIPSDIRRDMDLNHADYVEVAFIRKVPNDGEVIVENL